MCKKQSRRTQRALEAAMFGSPPRLRSQRPRLVALYADPTIGRYTHGSCPHCGNVCTPKENYTCPSCKVFYPANQTTVANINGTTIAIETYNASGDLVWAL